MRHFEDIAVGHRRELGSFTFTAEDIKRFAAQFDPQRFHLSEEEGRNSLFGGLAASGWHVGSVCMKLLVADGQRQRRPAGVGFKRKVEFACAHKNFPGFSVMAGLDPAIHVSSRLTKNVDARDKPGHDVVFGKGWV